MSRIFCVVDGMTDSEFDVREYKNLSAMRLSGFFDNCGGNMPETLGCILSLLGITPKSDIRGYIEALGAGIAVEKDDLILRGSCYSIDEKGFPAAPIAAPTAIADNRFEYHRLGSNQSLLILKGRACRLENMTTCSPADMFEKRAEQLFPRGCEPARELFFSLLNEKSCMLLWGQSAMTSLPKFAAESAAVCKKNVVKGLARALNMNVIEPSGATADTDTDLDEKVFFTLKAAERFPFVLLHINGADEAAHRKNGLEKRKFLQKVDEKVLSRLIASQHEITVASDHGSEFLTGNHTDTPQPVFLSVGKEKTEDGRKTQETDFLDFGGR